MKKKDPNQTPFQQPSVKPRTFMQLVEINARSIAAKKGHEKRRGKK